jgi:hypothetical protein
MYNNKSNNIYTANFAVRKIYNFTFTALKLSVCF